LLVKIQIDAASLERLDCAEKIDQRAAEPIYCPCHYNVEGAALRILKHLVEARTVIAALRAANPGITILPDDLPSPALCDLAQSRDLVLNRLFIG
jgi:hypothetical protein